MAYTIEIAPRAERDIKALHLPVRRRIGHKLDQLATDPRPHGCVKLAGNLDLYRIRAGDYRILYQVKAEVLLVLIVRVGHRRDIYR